MRKLRISRIDETGENRYNVTRLGVSNMKRFGRFLLCAVFMLLLFAGAQSLVERPEAAVPEAPAPAGAAQVCALPEPLQSALPDRPADARAARTEVRDTAHDTPSVPVLTADTNGIPLAGSRSYLRAAAHAFPLSDLPG